MEIRIGVYVCHCGLNIATTVDPKKVAEYAASLHSVEVARDYMFMCSDPGQDLILNDIKENNLNRVVVASCTPLMHERTFRRVCTEGGINPYLFEMANIREHCSWVHEDGATEKAKELVRAAVWRVFHHEPLEPMEVSINPNTLVVGGGIAGIQAALDIANAGYKVYLVEREPSIGGHMIQLDKTFPTLDCSACILTPKMSEVGSHPNIELLNYSEVEDVSGYIGNFKVKIKKKAKYVDEEKCNGCGLCFEGCPMILKNEFDLGLKERKAIYIPFPQAVPNKALIDRREERPCRAACVDACPVHTNVLGYTKLIAEGRFKEAYQQIRERNPFPSVCGRICYAPCEESCNRGQMDDPIAIRELKRFATEQVNIEELEIPPIIKTGKSVAVIGAGPAGLTAAHNLAVAGHDVEVFDKESEAGGMMRWAIPEYRLPESVLDNDLQYIWNTGVKFTGGKKVLLKDFVGSYDAIFIATGNPLSKQLNIKGTGLKGVLWGLDFLKAVKEGKAKIKDKVFVIGGGNVAIDVALSAKRLGAKDVQMACLEKKKEMPADKREIEQAVEEGIKIHTSWGPKRIKDSEGVLKGIELKRCTSVFDDKKRFNPTYDETKSADFETDMVIFAVGQSPDVSVVDGTEVKTKEGFIKIDTNYMTSLKGVFAGGDIVTGPAFVIDAIAAGTKAAHSINQYLKNEPLTLLEEEKIPEKLSEEEITNLKELYPTQKRIQERKEPLGERIQDFREVALCCTAQEAMSEAKRCLAAQIEGCIECGECERLCEPEAINFEIQDEIIEAEVGSIILATGFDQFDPAVIIQYGYGRYDNVITGLEFERLSNAAGPTEGRIQLKNGQPPLSVAIIHCVGSRDRNFHEYCSRVCCMYALKSAHIIKEKTNAEVYQMYIDMRCFGEGHEEFYERLSSEDGIKFVRGKASRVTDRALSEEEKEKLIVCVEDTLLGSLIRVPVDMVILANALVPRVDAERVANLFSISRRADGFFMERHVKLDPIATMNDGIFIAGCCEGPKDITDTVAQAKAAASEVLSLLAQGKIKIEPIVASVDEEVCSGCGLCETMCPYSALSLSEPDGVMIVNQAVCKGCGACASICPSGAASLSHFTFRQILDEVEALT